MSEPCFAWLRWAAAGFLALYLPGYALAYGLANFLFLCNLAVILAAIGIWTCNRTLLSSQAIGILPVAVAWTIDVTWRLVTGEHLFGATAYMWDPRWPLFTRLLSGYHVAVPIALVLALRRVGYDPGGYWLQSAIALAGVSLGRLFGPQANINYAFADPIFKRSFGSPLTHVAVVGGALILVGYPLSHLLLTWLLRPSVPTSPPRAT